MTIKRPLALLLCALLAAPGCATTRVGAANAMQPVDGAVLAEYVQGLPLGSPIRIDMAGGRVLRATLMKASSDRLIVQLRTRIPEPPIEIPMSDVLRVTPDTPGGSNFGKMIGIGIAAGAAAALSVFLIIAALISD